MLHTTFRGNLSTGSGGEDFLSFFIIYGRGGHLGHVTWNIYTDFGPPFPWRLHIKFGFDWSSGFGVYINDDPGVTLTYFTARSNLET